MTEEKKGIKELSEALDAVETIACKLIKAAKDGWGIDDAKLIMDQEIWDKIKAAAQGADQITGEIQDLDEDESAMLAGKGVKIAFKVAKALKEPKDAPVPPAA